MRDGEREGPADTVGVSRGTAGPGQAAGHSQRRTLAATFNGGEPGLNPAEFPVKSPIEIGRNPAEALRQEILSSEVPVR